MVLMPGKKGRFIYQLYKNGELVEEGTQEQILGDRYVNRNQLYNAWKHRQKFMGEFMVERIRKDWKPEQREEYYYCAHSGVIKDYFDFNNLTCLARFMAKNCFRTREEAVREYPNIEEKLKRFYVNS